VPCCAEFSPQGAAIKGQSIWMLELCWVKDCGFVIVKRIVDCCVVRLRGWVAWLSLLGSSLLRRYLPCLSLSCFSWFENVSLGIVFADRVLGLIEGRCIFIVFSFFKCK
jgi:hypothetical protein